VKKLVITALLAITVGALAVGCSGSNVSQEEPDEAYAAIEAEEERLEEVADGIESEAPAEVQELVGAVSDAPTEAASGSTATRSWKPIWVTVKYRPTPVDVGAPHFKSLGHRESRLVTGAWYDGGNNYLVINLNGTNYHYCGFPRSAWQALRNAESMGRHYNAEIRGEHDCRNYIVPSYD